jgi:DNA-binding transcriptional LysR family regulator
VRSFLAALDQGSLLGASRVLKVSQPTLGRHIAELESQLGAVLFERTGRGLVPTATGKQLAQSARAMEAAALQMERTLSGHQQEAAGTVRITASVPVAVQLMPRVLAQMRAVLPDVQVELVSSNAVSNLLRREADIALRMVRPDQTSLIARKLGDVEIYACANQAYIQKHGAPEQPQDLIKHQLIGGDADGTIMQGFLAMGFPVRREQFALRCDDFIAQWQAVRAGLGIGFVAGYMQRSDPEVVRVLEGRLDIPPLPMWLTVHREIRTNQRIRKVFDFLAQALPRML